MAPPFPTVDEHDVNVVAFDEFPVMVSVCDSPSCAEMAAPPTEPEVRETLAKVHPVIVAVESFELVMLTSGLEMFTEDAAERVIAVRENCPLVRRNTGWESPLESERENDAKLTVASEAISKMAAA